MIIDGVSYLKVGPEIHEHVSAFVCVHIRIRDKGIERKLSKAKLNDGNKPVFIKNSLYVKSFYFLSNFIENKVNGFLAPFLAESASCLKVVCQ